MERISMFIGGSSHEPVSGAWFPTDDPFRGAPWAEVARGSEGDVELAVAAAVRAGQSPEWGGLSASARGRLMTRLADVLDRHAERLAEIEVQDNGKLMAEMSAQTRYLPEWYRYFGGLADKVEGTVPPIDKGGYLTFTRREPVGVVAIITPWNSPLMLLAWKLAPALAAGCTVVVKPSEFASASTVQLVRLLHEEGGLPAGVVNVVTGFGAEVGSPLVRHPAVRQVSFTGSDSTGRVIAEQAASGCKRVTLELGGKSPNIVFADADLDAAVNGVVSGIFAATGQTCIAG
jgi:aldehyde dehydrogenase (NAD+)